MAWRTIAQKSAILNSDQIDTKKVKKHRDLLKNELAIHYTTSIDTLLQQAKI